MQPEMSWVGQILALLGFCVQFLPAFPSNFYCTRGRHICLFRTFLSFCLVCFSMVQNIVAPYHWTEKLSVQCGNVMQRYICTKMIANLYWTLNFLYLLFRYYGFRLGIVNWKCIHLIGLNINCCRLVGTHLRTLSWWDATQTRSSSAMTSEESTLLMGTRGACYTKSRAPWHSRESVR